MTRLRRVACGLLLSLVAVILLIPAPARAAEVSSLDEYRRRLVTAHEYAVDGLEAGAWRTERSSQDLATLLDRFLPGTERVRVGGRIIDVDNSVLRSLVASLEFSKTAEERRETLVAVESHLGSLRLAVADAADVGASDPALLAKLLARPDLSSRPTLSDGIARLLDRVTRWLQDWFARVMNRRGAATATDVALGAVFVALAALLAFAFVQVWRSISASVARHDERVMTERAEDAAVVAAAEGLPADALAYADTLAAEGRFREAVRALFGGAARTLVDLGLLRSTRTRTNAELLADLAPVAPPVHAPLSELSATFERAWYGHADPGGEGFDAARARYRESLRHAERIQRERDFGAEAVR